ncbi:MAG: cytochrome c [Acetobacteraceae bacterium]|nr:cytochrome c [Acetobacteraceae bacterium]
MRARLLALVIGGALAVSAGARLAQAEDTNESPSTEAAEKGAEVFESHGCGYCHENGGRAAGKGPQLMGTSRTDDFIMFRIVAGKEGRMPAFGGSLSGEQLTDLLAYIRSLKG